MPVAMDSSADADQDQDELLDLDSDEDETESEGADDSQTMSASEYSDLMGDGLDAFNQLEFNPDSTEFLTGEWRNEMDVDSQSKNAATESLARELGVESAPGESSGGFAPGDDSLKQGLALLKKVQSQMKGSALEKGQEVLMHLRTQQLKRAGKLTEEEADKLSELALTGALGGITEEDAFKKMAEEGAFDDMLKEETVSDTDAPWAQEAEELIAEDAETAQLEQAALTSETSESGEEEWNTELDEVVEAKDLPLPGEDTQAPEASHWWSFLTEMDFSIDIGFGFDIKGLLSMFAISEVKGDFSEKLTKTLDVIFPAEYRQLLISTPRHTYALGLALALLLLSSLAPFRVETMAITLLDKPLRYALKGTMVTLGIGAVSILLAATIVLLPIVAFLVPIYLVSWIAGFAAICQAVGEKMPGNLASQQEILGFLLGAVVLFPLFLLPYIGPLLFILLSFPAAGVAFTTKFGSNSWAEQNIRYHVEEEEEGEGGEKGEKGEGATKATEETATKTATKTATETPTEN